MFVEGAGYSTGDFDRAELSTEIGKNEAFSWVYLNVLRLLGNLLHMLALMSLREMPLLIPGLVVSYKEYFSHGLHWESWFSCQNKGEQARVSLGGLLLLYYKKLQSFHYGQCCLCID